MRNSKIWIMLIFLSWDPVLTLLEYIVKFTSSLVKRCLHHLIFRRWAQPLLDVLSRYCWSWSARLLNRRWCTHYLVMLWGLNWWLLPALPVSIRAEKVELLLLGTWGGGPLSLVFLLLVRDGYPLVVELLRVHAFLLIHLFLLRLDIHRGLFVGLSAWLLRLSSHWGMF